MRSLLLAIPLATLAGCMTMHDLDRQTPVRTEALRGDYLELAQCIEARQIRAGQPGQIKLSNDKARKEALITWNHDLGTFATFMFSGMGPQATEMKVYSTIGFKEAWMTTIKSCEQPA